MVSPITVGLVAGVGALIVVFGGHWGLAIAGGALAWTARVFVATRIARRVGALPRRIDPFALREPWRFFVRDAIQARTRFVAALDDAVDGPLRDRLAEIGAQLDRGVERCWEVAQRGQQLTDARRLIQIDALAKERAELAPADPRLKSIDAQIASHARLREREDVVGAQLEALETRLDEVVVRAAELGTRSGAIGELESAGDAVSGVVRELEALRLGLDDVDPAP